MDITRFAKNSSYDSIVDQVLIWLTIFAHKCVVQTYGEGVENSHDSTCTDVPLTVAICQNKVSFFLGCPKSPRFYGTCRPIYAAEQNDIKQV